MPIMRLFPVVLEFKERASGLILILLSSFLFLNPFPHTTALRELTYYSAFLLSIIYVYRHYKTIRLASPLDIPFGAYGLCALFGLFFALDRENSLNDFVFHLLKYYVYYYMLITFFSTKRLFSLLAWIIAVSITLFSLGAVIYFYIIEGHFIFDRIGLPGITGTNNLGLYTMTALAILLTVLKEKKTTNILFVYAASIILVLTSLLTQTRSIWLSLILTLTLAPRKKWAITFIIFVVGLLVVIAPYRERLVLEDLYSIKKNERFTILKIYGEIIQEHPITGLGYGMRLYYHPMIMQSFEKRRIELQNNYVITQFYPPHNFYVDTVVRLGIPGIFATLAILWMFFAMGYRMMRDSDDPFVRKWTISLCLIMVTFLFQLLFADLLFGPHLILFYTLLAMMTILVRINTFSRFESTPSAL